MLCNFVSVDRTYGSRSSAVTPGKLTSPELIESFLNDIGCHTLLLLTKEEQLGYKSLLTQKDSLLASRTSLVLQKESLRDSARSLLLQYNSPDSFAYQTKSDTVQKTGLNLEKNSIQYQIDNPQTGTDTTSLSAQLNLIGTENTPGTTRFGLLVDSNNLIQSQENQWNNQKVLIENQIRNFPYEYSDIYTGATLPHGTVDGTLTRQNSNAQAQIRAIDKQLSDLDEQINLYIAKSLTYQTQFRNYYKTAARRKGNTGENLLNLLECRLDNVLFRLAFARTRMEARQIVDHRQVL
ncbi:MAG: hypothetical protein IKP68_04090, partial [Clostridia bacterium]|nr:hypothetical protein [Clostridia bacterium]